MQSRFNWFIYLFIVKITQFIHLHPPLINNQHFNADELNLRPLSHSPHRLSCSFFLCIISQYWNHVLLLVNAITINRLLEFVLHIKHTPRMDLSFVFIFSFGWKWRRNSLISTWFSVWVKLQLGKYARFCFPDHWVGIILFFVALGNETILRAFGSWRNKSSFPHFSGKKHFAMETSIEFKSQKDCFANQIGTNSNVLSQFLIWFLNHLSTEMTGIRLC